MFSLTGVSKWNYELWESAGRPYLDQAGWCSLCMTVCKKDMTGLYKLFGISEQLLKQVIPRHFRVGDDQATSSSSTSELPRHFSAMANIMLSGEETSDGRPVYRTNDGRLISWLNGQVQVEGTWR